MALQLYQSPLSISLSTATSSSSSSSRQNLSLPLNYRHRHYQQHQQLTQLRHGSRNRNTGRVFVEKEETELRFSSPLEIDKEQDEDEDEEEEDDNSEPDPEDLEYVSQIKRVLELLKKNRDMLFSEVKLTIMIEDPRDAERRRLLGIDDSDAPTREDLADALEEVNKGKIPKDREALKLLAEEMNQWPNLEVSLTKKGPRKSLYAKATDTGVDPKVAAKRLNIDWDSAAEIDESGATEDDEVPAALGYGALYLVTAFPVIIGISVVLILFYNSLQ